MSGVASGVAREQLPIWNTIPNMQHAKLLCDTIRKWQVKQVSPSAAIEWRAISATLKRKGVSLSPTCCHVLWKYLAYGVVIARSSESEGVGIARSSESEGVGIARSSDSEDMNQSSVVSSIPCDHDEVDIESDEEDFHLEPQIASMAFQMDSLGTLESENNDSPEESAPASSTLFSESLFGMIVSHVPRVVQPKEPKLQSKKPPPKKEQKDQPSSTSSTVVPEKNISSKQKPTLENGGVQCPYCDSIYAKYSLKGHFQRLHPVEFLMNEMLDKLDPHLPKKSKKKSKPSAKQSNPGSNKRKAEVPPAEKGSVKKNVIPPGQSTIIKPPAKPKNKSKATVSEKLAEESPGNSNSHSQTAVKLPAKPKPKPKPKTLAKVAPLQVADKKKADTPPAEKVPTKKEATLPQSQARVKPPSKASSKALERLASLPEMKRAEDTIAKLFPSKTVVLQKHNSVVKPLLTNEARSPPALTEFPRTITSSSVKGPVFVNSPDRILKSENSASPSVSGSKRKAENTKSSSTIEDPVLDGPISMYKKIKAAMNI